MEPIKSCSTAPASQQEHETKARIFQICARDGVCCIGIQRGSGIPPDFVLFQPTVTTLVDPLATFTNPDEAIAAIKAKLVESESAPYAPMSRAELADLEREAGRSLTEEEAQQFRIRKLKKQLIDNILDQARTCGAK